MAGSVVGVKELGVLKSSQLYFSLFAETENKEVKERWRRKKSKRKLKNWKSRFSCEKSTSSSSVSVFNPPTQKGIQLKSSVNVRQRRMNLIHVLSSSRNQQQEIG